MAPRKKASPAHAPLASSGVRAPSRKFSQEWMPKWLEDVIKTGTVQGACALANISVNQFHKDRLLDVAFDEAYRIHLRVVDSKIAEAVMQKAATGDIRWQTLYYQRVREGVMGGDTPHEAAATGLPDITPEAAEAMIRFALGQCDPSAAVPPPSPPLSRPKAPRRR